MECPHCKREINVSVSTCPYCGAEVMKICSACKNYVRAELDHCPSCGTSLISLGEAAQTVKPRREGLAEPSMAPRKGAAAATAGVGDPPAAGKTTGEAARIDLQALPLPDRATLGWLTLAVVVYGCLIAVAAVFLQSVDHVPLLVLGTIMGGAVGAALGLGKALTGLPPHQDDVLMDIWPGMGAGAFTGLFLAFLSVQEDLLAPEVLLVAAAGAVFGVLFSLAFSWGSGPEGSQGIRGFVGNPVVGLLLGICLGIGAMLGMGNLMLRLRRPGGF